MESDRSPQHPQCIHYREDEHDPKQRPELPDAITMATMVAVPRGFDVLGGALNMIVVYLDMLGKVVGRRGFWGELVIVAHA